MQFDKDLQLIYITEVTKKDIMAGLSGISKGYVDEKGNFYTRDSKGQLFRKKEDGTIVFMNDKEQFHREDGPAIEYTHGSKQWFKNGERHRLDGPAIESVDGHKEWWVNGKLHRLDGPAVEWADGSKAWWVNDKKHRLDGPAVEWADSSKEWWINNKKYKEQQWRKMVKELQLK